MKAKTDWLLLIVPVTEATTDQISNYLFELGANGVIEHGDRLEAYYPISEKSAKEKVVSFLQSLQAGGFFAEPEKVTAGEIPDQDWNLEWKKNYHSLAVGQRMLIRPSWEPVPDHAPECVIEIDPEMAFGTGTHATTQLCLRLLEENIHPGDFVLDVGTGTGILAIAAVKLGADAAYAFDVDPVAVATAEKNAAANQVADALHLSVGTLATFVPPSRRFDWVIANINRDQIVKMLPLLQKMLDYPVQIILSGILVEEEDIISQELRRLQWEPCEVYHQQEWLACVAKKTG